MSTRKGTLNLQLYEKHDRVILCPAMGAAPINRKFSQPVLRRCPTSLFTKRRRKVLVRGCRLLSIGWCITAIPRCLYLPRMIVPGTPSSQQLDPEDDIIRPCRNIYTEGFA